MIRNIITQRERIQTPSMQIVYEWEDELARELDVKLSPDFVKEGVAWSALKRIVPSLARMGKCREPSLAFEISALTDGGHNSSNYIPAVIDFFLRNKWELRRFYRNFARCPLVLVSSAEVCDYLKSLDCPLNIQHWALSIPSCLLGSDMRNGSLIRSYDVALMGRENPVLLSFLDQYRVKHPTVSYVFRKKEAGRFVYYSSDGKCLGAGDKREDYLRIMRMCRVGLYSTPGMDGANPNANGFNQVTPRFLEFLSCGCHIIARYPDNADTNYYRLSEFSPSVDSYDQFEFELEKKLNTPANEKHRLEYLRNHTTATRADELRRLLKGVFE